MIAEPIPVSVARVIPRTAKRLGYHHVAICANCRDATVLIGDGPAWVHRPNGLRECRPAALRGTPVARMPATVARMPMSNAERASTAGRASRASLTAEQRAESARAAARAAHSVPAYARKLAARWEDATDDERAEARKVLRAAGIIR